MSSPGFSAGFGLAPAGRIGTPMPAGAPAGRTDPGVMGLPNPGFIGRGPCCTGCPNCRACGGGTACGPRFPCGPRARAAASLAASAAAALPPAPPALFAHAPGDRAPALGHALPVLAATHGAAFDHVEPAAPPTGPIRGLLLGSRPGLTGVIAPNGRLTPPAAIIGGDMPTGRGTTMAGRAAAPVGPRTLR